VQSAAVARAWDGVVGFDPDGSESKKKTISHPTTVYKDLPLRPYRSYTHLSFPKV
jgi:hypothetical protein